MRIKILLNVFIAVFLCHFMGQAQDTLDVAPFTPDGELNLAPTIFSDTTETGERANLNRVYRLQRGQIYLMDQTVFADYPIRLVADGDDSQRPPILVRGKYPTGDPIKTFFTFTGSNQSHSFKNIIFTGVDEDREYHNQWNRGLKIAGDNVELHLTKCIMNAWAGLFLEVEGDNASLYIKDSEWRNGVGTQGAPWGAQQTVVFSNHLKNLIVLNNTFFNTGGFWLFQEDGVADSVKVEHNTLFTGVIDLLRMRDLVNADFRSNLFYGTHAYGQNQAERDASWFDKDGQIISMFSIDTSGVDLLASNGLTESDKRIVVSNNTYYSPQALQDWWATIPGLYTPVWMHDRTMAMFADDAAYPNLEAFDNFEMDPNFVDTDMATWVMDEVITYCSKTRNGFGSTTSPRNYDAHTGNSDVLLMPWPLPESLVYTNADMLVGGHDGLPVGDLNWFPDKRAIYNEDGTVATHDLKKYTSVNVIDNISPNPASDKIFLDINFEQQTFAKIEVININGVVVKTLAGKKYTAGKNVIEIDVNEMATGAYSIKVSSENNVSAKRFIKH
ncbi:MAG TPA: T9SS type A sorting domain-containing protein [Phaeodactylibacter sp.]|nr:T9SS type A sorting domain-containing protein [Phaeodactylibacter sp.]